MKSVIKKKTDITSVVIFVVCVLIFISCIIFMIKDMNFNKKNDSDPPAVTLVNIESDNNIDKYYAETVMLYY